MQSEALFHILEQFSGLSIAIPIAAGFRRLRHLNFVGWIVFIYALVSAATEALSFIQTEMHTPNYLVGHIFTLLECSAFALVYFSKFESRRTRNAIILFYILFIALAFIMLVLGGRYKAEDSILVTYESWFFITLSFGYFFKLMRELNIPRLIEYYFSWINTAVFVYFSMGFLLFLFNWYLEKCDLTTYSLLYSPHLITNIVFNCLLATGLWTIKQK